MCLKHYCDINVEGVDNIGGLVDTAVLYASGDGTYVFDFSNCYCPEIDSLWNSFEGHLYDGELTPEQQVQAQEAADKWWDENQCQHTWTAVLYDNFTPIGGSDAPATTTPAADGAPVANPDRVSRP